MINDKFHFTLVAMADHLPSSNHFLGETCNSKPPSPMITKKLVFWATIIRPSTIWNRPSQKGLHLWTYLMVPRLRGAAATPDVRRLTNWALVQSAWQLNGRLWLKVGLWLIILNVCCNISLWLSLSWWLNRVIQPKVTLLLKKIPKLIITRIKHLGRL